MLPRFAIVILTIINGSPIFAQQADRPRILALYTAKNDLAHISFANEADRWFQHVSMENGLQYTSSQDWNYLQHDSLQHFAVVIFLDTRPDSPAQRNAFEQYMKNGGAWMGFHFAGFALTPSQYPQNWDWYHNEFLGSASYVSNTWRPTSAVLRIEDENHAIARKIPKTFSSSPCEWYRWEKDLRKNTKIKILASIDPASFPLGTGPKPHEIWHSGYYPVVWTNLDYRMIYFNMGHNDIDYEGKTNQELSHTFGNKIQDQLILNALLWLSGGKEKRAN
jgi:uncharacterized protein